jgi:hypothetical protein
MGDFFFAGNTGPGTVQTAAASTSSTTARPQAVREDRDEAVSLRAGQPQSGRLQAGDAVMSDDNSLFDIYTYQARAGERITLNMRSSDFDTYLTVARMTGDEVEILVRDDDIVTGPSTCWPTRSARA